MVIKPYGPHFMEDQYLMELMNPETVEPVPKGQRGLSVATNLFFKTVPLLLSVTGDCGRTHIPPGGFEGRADDLSDD
jgi:phenylacetate-CoA ligase